MVTLHDVARAAGVSISTVSRALSAPDKVAEATRRRVTAVVQELGYTPNRAASLLRSGRTGSVGLVVPDLENPYFASLAKGVQSRAQEAGMSVLIADSDENPRHEPELLSQLVQQTDGVLLAAPRDLAADFGVMDGTPAILINAEHPDLASVSVDYEEAMVRAVAHLRALGHTRIAYVGGPTRSRSDGQRRAGLKLAGDQYDGLEILDLGAFSPKVEGGEAAADLALGSGATATIAYNDLVAVGLLRILARRGVDVPAQMSVMGCDDTLASQLATPALTTMYVDIRGAGEAAVNMFLELSGRTPGKGRVSDLAEHRTLPVQLVVRDSTAAPRRA
ncbi:LacI family transcriptional regulator [Acidipropionibacterium acidipropionici]|jgi:DNA-binding LacI/PurR family transcriptional regulator|uniref:LacI family transcriptional regulator n=2 Tax=Acidipropionibacterium acidipropionici TaxID=1748 RepID=A0AAC8YG53_9ACTN|nr:LacI family DNA-binding transcriptional regulator [Acidipropionibacterium acidipropionici]AMS05990.1 LacI family transcriptional regulator [Acidipropionibacterium acidipropionici]AOZ47453.1 LacI family transcriptional regulator [Acidipropionibacterium acidipropionici]AZP36432.1 LacI family transcriptional regulator [Acidipropionibacterium acidipropionici]MDN6555031.1 LacI family transcriptional regulator [Acidipropionibacterium acidipropionici]